MSSLDTNIVLIALPTIGRELPSTSPFDLIWILVGYQLVISSILVNIGRISDLFGRVKLYNLGFAIFTVGSALCSLSQTGQQLIISRMIQGVGAAFLFANSAAIITDAFPAEERGKALGTNQVAIVVGSVTGLALGGLLTAVAGWRSVFWINIPIGVFATFWAHIKLRELATLRRGEKIDLAGNFTFVGGLVLVLVAVTLYALEFVSVQLLLLMIGSGVTLLVLFLFIETHTRSPMLDLSLFRVRLFTAGNLATLLNALARGTVTFVLALYLQGPTMNLDPLVAGIFLIPNSASTALLGPVSGWLSDRYGARLFSTLGLIVSAVGFIMLAQIGPTVSFSELAAPLIMIGGGLGLFASPNRASVMSSVPPDTRGLAAGVNTTLNNIGMTFSRSLAFLVMGLVLPLPYLQMVFTGRSAPANFPWQSDFMLSIHLVFYVSTIFVLTAIIPSILRGPRK